MSLWKLASRIPKEIAWRVPSPEHMSKMSRSRLIKLVRFAHSVIWIANEVQLNWNLSCSQFWVVALFRDAILTGINWIQRSSCRARQGDWMAFKLQNELQIRTKSPTSSRIAVELNDFCLQLSKMMATLMILRSILPLSEFYNFQPNANVITLQIDLCKSLRFWTRQRRSRHVSSAMIK